MTTITQGATVHTPRFVDGYESQRPSRNIVHPIIGNAESAVTSRPAGLRTGTLRCQFSTESPAITFEVDLAGSGVFVLADGGVTIGMNFLTTGPIRRQLDPQTRSRWWVIFDYIEVS